MRALTVLTAAIILAGCNAFGPDDEEFVIKADSVSAPGAVSGGAPFEVRFYGVIGRNLCWRFKEFRVSRTVSGADITIIGVNGEEGRTCAQAVSVMEGEPLTINPPVADPFELRVHQPDGTILRKTIRAE